MMKPLVFYCACCHRKMTLEQGKYSLYWRCPNYDSKNRKQGQKPCMNRINCKDAGRIEQVYQSQSSYKKGENLILEPEFEVTVGLVHPEYTILCVYKKYHSKYRKRGYHWRKW